MIRLFAVFEATLREYWGERGRGSQPPARDLLDGVAAYWRVSHAALQGAHGVRNWRNVLVHGGDAGRVGIREAKSRLSQFLSFCPGLAEPAARSTPSSITAIHEARRTCDRRASFSRSGRAGYLRL